MNLFATSNKKKTPSRDERQDTPRRSCHTDAPLAFLSVFASSRFLFAPAPSTTPEAPHVI
jgi:hypothetical protein